MPIYEYRCDACGHGLEVIQKLSEPVLTVCPECAKPALRKQVSAAGFQLKGSGWYATDFKGKSAKADKETSSDTAKSETKGPSDTAKSETKGPSDTTPKAGCGGGGCGCH